MAGLTGTHRAVRGILDRLAAESIAALRSSGAARMLQPIRYGGLGLPADEFVSAVHEIAALDSSLGWLAAMFNTAAHDVAGLPEYARDEVWDGSPDALVAIGSRGTGELAGARLTGHWPDVVGAEHAEWLLLPVDKPVERRILLLRSRVRVECVRPTGLDAPGVCDVTVSEVAVEDRHVFADVRDRAVVISGACAAAAVVGSADGVWRTHVEQVRARLATTYGGDDVTNEAAAQIARAASDIDAAKLQITTMLAPPAPDPAAATRACRQAVARARGAADRLLGSSRHALDASDAVTHRWRDVHSGCRLFDRIRDRDAQTGA